MASDSVTDGLKTTVDWQKLKVPIAVLPVGAFEQHGPHLPLLTDTVKVELFARYVARELGGALLPALSICQSLEHTGFRGTLSLRPETFMAVVRDIASELERQRFTRLVVVNGHGGNFALGPVVRDINRSDRPLKVVLVNYWECDTSDVGRKLREGEVHAGAWETSVMLAAFPETVGDWESVQAVAPLPGARQSDLNHAGMGTFRPNGVWGDPRGASAEAGEAIIASIQDNLVAFVRERLVWFDQSESYGGGGPFASD
jgi:creatinine amidohydrolase